MRRFIVWTVLGLFLASTLMIAGVLPITAQNVIFHNNVKVNDDSTSTEQTACDICFFNTDIYVVWQDSRGGDRDIYFSRSTSHGATFQTNVQVDDGGAAETYDPAMATDSSGKIYVVWSDSRGGSQKIFVANSTDKGVTFGSSSRVDDTGASADDLKYPDIAITALDKIVVTWTDERGGATEEDIYVSTSSDGETWSSSIRVDDDAGSNHQGASKVDTYLNNVYVIWEDERAGHLDVRMRKSADGGATFPSASVVVADGANSQKAPSISVDGNGDVYAIWADFRTGKYDVNCANSTDGGATFSLPNRVDNGDVTTSQYEPSIYAFNGSQLLAVWTDNQGDNSENIWFGLSNDKGVTWHNHTQVDDAPLPVSDQNRAIVVSNGTGDAQVVWVDNRGGDRDIYFGQMDYSIPPVNLPPELTPYNITPTLGCPTTSFVFQLTYTDLDGDMPDAGYPKLYVYSDDAGTVPYKSGTYTMDQYSSGDTDVTDGKDYVKTLKFDDELNFTYKYQVKSDLNLDIITSSLLVGPSIDAVEVEFKNSSNELDEWITSTAVWCNVTITDIGGSEVDGTNLWYRYTKPGTGNMSRWYHILDRPINESIFLYKALVFGEGDGNYVQWNATDVAGNGPTYSPMYNIKIDVTQVTFLDGPPASGTTVNTTAVDVQVTVTDKVSEDMNVSGVNQSSLQVRNKYGAAAWTAWDSSGITITESNDTHHTLLVHMKNLTKGDNLIQFRGEDNAGTGYAESDQYKFILDDSVNFPPTAPTWIYPNSTTDTTPKIAWGRGVDPESDPLTYWIQIGTASQKDYLLSWTPTGSNTYYDVIFEMKKDMTYVVQLKCFDGNHYSEVFETTLNITSTGNVPPEPPSNIQPKVTMVYDPTITWDPSEDPDSFNIMYFIQISTEEGMGDLLPWTQVMGTATEYKVAGTLGLEDGTYVIELQAFDGIDFSDVAVSSLKIATFDIGIQNFATDLTVGEVSTVVVTVSNLGTADDHVTIFMEGTIFDQARIFIDENEYDPLLGVVYDFLLNESKEMRLQFRVNPDAAPGDEYSLSFEAYSESGEITETLIKNDIVIKAKGGGNGGGNGTDDDDDDYGPDKLVKDYWWALLLAIVFILVLVVFIGVASSKSKKKKEKDQRRRDEYDDLYTDRPSQDTVYAPDRDRGPPPSYERQYPSRASPMAAPQPEQQPAHIEDEYMDALMQEAPQEEVYQEEVYQEPMEEMQPLEEDDLGDEPKDIYGYDEDGDDLDLDMEPLDDEVGEDEDYMNIDDL
jgi:hypothetical protein